MNTLPPLTRQLVARTIRTAPKTTTICIDAVDQSATNFIAALKIPAPDVPASMVITHDGNEYILLALMPRAGGYVTLAQVSNSALDKIKGTLNGIVAACDLFARRSSRPVRLRKERAKSVGNLSPRQQDIIGLLARGLTYREIGTKLSIGVETVRTHIKEICRKLQVRTPIEAVVRYSAQGRLVHNNE